MSATKQPRNTSQVENDPRAELGLRGAVRDKAKLGDEQYNVTPPRSEVRAPQESEARVSCAACRAELDPAASYRSDGQEYAYHFCDARCFGRWRSSADSQGSGASPSERSGGAP